MKNILAPVTEAPSDEDRPRPLYQIAREIRVDWASPYFGAVPYLDAMACLDKITDAYGAAETIVIYFLGNARSWHGDIARHVKAELNKLARAA